VSAVVRTPRAGRPSLAAVLTDEGLRLFFPLAALYAALWPAWWVLANGFDLPLARSVPPTLWHAHEMLIGAFGAALIGFITTAVPEWTDTPGPRPRTLFALAAAWGTGRVVGLLGADALGLAGALADLAWLAMLVLFVLRVSWRKRTTALGGFCAALAGLLAFEALTRYAFLGGDAALAQRAGHLAGFVFLALLGLALARITVPVTNRILDPTQQSSPFRPHPGRVNLAPGLVAVAVAGDLGGLSPAASAYLLIAAGAAFLDRVSEAFIGRAGLRAEILALSTSSLLAGTGLLLIGAARLGAPFPESAGLHLALMGGLGTGVLSVFTIAGLLHTGRGLGLAPLARVALGLLVAAVAVRVLPALGLVPAPPGPPHALASLLWASAFLAWLAAYWPLLSDPATVGRSC